MASYFLDDEKAGQSNTSLCLLEDLRAAKNNPIFRTFVPNGEQGRKRRLFTLSTTNEKGQPLEPSAAALMRAVFPPDLSGC